MNMKQQIYQYLSRREMKRHPRHTEWPQWQKLRNILIVYNQADEREITELQRALMNEDKRVSTYTVTAKDATLFGTLKKKARAQIPTECFDILIDLSHADSWALQYLSLYVCARFKAGRIPTPDNMPEKYDFVMNMPNAAPKEVVRQMKKYILQIESKD